MTIKVRKLNTKKDSEVELVATRMQQTLIDVLGNEKGKEFYSKDWIRNRLNEFINMGNNSYIALSEDQDVITGHVIVSKNDQNKSIGFFSTIYVSPEHRKQGIATRLITEVQNWCNANDLKTVEYNTAEDNERLIRLYKKHGYKIALKQDCMVKMIKELKTP